MTFTCHPIGVIRTPFTGLTGMPIQPTGASDAIGTIELRPDFQAGLQDLAGFSHIILLYHFHRSQGFALTVVPFLDTQPRGLFATRAPRRPNPIGLSVVRLQRIEKGVLHVQGVDMLDGTPLLDIKPYVPAFDAATTVTIGWLAETAQQAMVQKADGRFQDTSIAGCESHDYPDSSAHA
jgi:tRNA-Thr(GGU) m(6)t(6)A37 methyltransferase TsaA